MEQFKVIHNGTRQDHVFPAEEFAARLASLRAVMAQNDLDAALFTSIHNINYYTGFVYCGFGRPYGLVVTAEGTTTITANIDAGQPWRRGIGADDNVVYTDWERDNFIRAAARELSSARRIGVEDDHLTLMMRGKLSAALPRADWRDIAADAMTLRMIKSAPEIAVIREGARIADLGGAACVEAASEGVPEYEVALHATAVMVREIAATFPQGDLMDSWTWFQSGINTDGAHNPLTTRTPSPGDILSLNCFPMIAGYYTALERTLFFKNAGKRALELWEINLKVHRRGLTLIRPGARCCDIATELNDIYASHGLIDARTFGYGHSFGSLCHYYGREAGLELREDIQTVLQPGMVISMEPMIMIPAGSDGAGGYREHDILVVGSDGAENITRFPLGPEYNIIG